MAQMIDQNEQKGKKGIKVKDLAKEVGITSRELIDRCRVEGIPAQNSITKLDRATEAKVRAWFNIDAREPLSNE